MGTTFLGQGAMGRALASATREPVTVWNRSPGTAIPGAAVAGTVSDAVSGDGPVVVCLADHHSVHDVLDPVAARMAGRTVVNLTTTTPQEARELAGWAARHGIRYLDGAIMAVPEMIGGPASAVFYSGSEEAYHDHRPLLDAWGTGTYFGPDAGRASLYDLAMLTGMYTMIAGFLHGAAMVGADGVSASDFAALQAPFLAAMAGQLSGYAGTVDDRDYTGDGQQSLRFTGAALATLRRAGAEQGVASDVLAPVHALVQQQIDAGFGAHGTARLFESLRSTR